MIKITERGWCAHFCGGSRCNFRSTTHIEFNENWVVVSTVGQFRKLNGDGYEEIGLNRHYETMAFEAIFENPYWEADIAKQLSFDSPWSISELEFETDKKANDMHENAVKEFCERITNAL